MDYYDHEGTKIPAATVWAWNWANWVSHFGVIVFPLLLLLDAAVLAGLECLPSPARWLASLWFSTVLLGVILIMGFSTIASVVPLKVLTETTPAKEAPADPEGQ